MRQKHLHALALCAVVGPLAVGAFVPIPANAIKRNRKSTNRIFSPNSIENKEIAFRDSTTRYSEAHDGANAVINGPLDALIHSPSTWSVTVMLSIVALLLLWESSVKWVRTKVPKTLLVVVESMLSEIGGLGFVGLFLSLFVVGGPLGENIAELSATFLGDEEILLETFEFLHTTFFEVGIGFFIVSGISVGAVLFEINQLSDISKLACLTDDCDEEITLDELADALEVECVTVDQDGDGEVDDDEARAALRATHIDPVLKYLFMTPSDRMARCLVLRERLLQLRSLPPYFRIEKYMEKIFAKNLQEIVELSPLTWLPLIPLIGLCNSIDLQNDVVSASSLNAFKTCGEFYSTPYIIYPTILSQIITLGWGIYNYWKIQSIVGMIEPTLVKDRSNGGSAYLLPPKYEESFLRGRFSSTPAFLEPIERVWGEPARNDHERLFGTLGAAGPEFFLNSIKFHSWLNVAQIVFYGSQVVLRDVHTITYGEVAMSGNPDAVTSELTVYSVFIILAILQLAISPATFSSFCVATSTEELVNDRILQTAVKESRFEEELEEVAKEFFFPVER